MVEISQQVGQENVYIFGQSSDQVIHRYEAGDYIASQWYEGDPNIRRAVDFLTGPQMLAAGREENLRRLQNELSTRIGFRPCRTLTPMWCARDRRLANYACDPLGWQAQVPCQHCKGRIFLQ